MERLRIIDSATITLFSYLFFKGVGHQPQSGKKKGTIKVQSVIHACYDEVLTEARRKCEGRIFFCIADEMVLKELKP